MPTYYLEATGSNTYPFDTREKAAISLYELFAALDIEGIYELVIGDIVYVHGLIYEPNEYGWYSFNGASLLGENSLTDRISISSGTIYAGSSGIIQHNISFFTDSEDSYQFMYIEGNFEILRCRFNGNNIATNAVYCSERLTSLSILCNTFENFIGDAIFISDNGPADSFVGTGQTSRDWKHMAVDAYNDIYVCVSTSGNIYKRIHGNTTFVSLAQTSRSWWGIAVSPNGDVYACVNNSFSGGIYKQTGGIGNFDEVQVRLGDITDNEAPTGLAVAANGDVFVTQGTIRTPAGSRTHGIYKQTGGIGAFVSLGIAERYWSGICVAPNGTIYACTDGGDIYISTDGGTSFNPLSQTSRAYKHIYAALNGDIYVCIQSGVVYRQIGGSGNFVLFNTNYANYFGICIDNSGDIYTAVSGGDILKFTLGGESITLESKIIANSFNNVASIQILYTYLSFQLFHFLNNAFSFIDGPEGLILQTDNTTIDDLQNTNNILENPLFLGVEPNPLQIDTTSPCFIAGLFTEDSINDILGNAFNNPPSIGAYEAAGSVLDFTGIPIDGYSPLTVHFTYESSTPVTEWLWDFGDGTTSTEATPLHIYLLPGKYTVRFTINGEDSVVKENYVNVYKLEEGDALFAFNEEKACGDISVVYADLKRDASLETAIYLSLFTDQRAEDSDVLPNNQKDKRGWWADNTLGSKLWLLEREKLMNKLASRAEQYSKEALQWLVEEGIADTIKTQAFLQRNDTALILNIQIVKKVGEPIYFKYYYNWEAQIARSV